jgi:hypothetical protein
LLAASDEALAALVRGADDRRELIMTSLLGAAYSLPGSEAHHFARTFHALHLAALMRGQGDGVAYVDGPTKALIALLESNFATD